LRAGNWIGVCGAFSPPNGIVVRRHGFAISAPLNEEMDAAGARLSMGRSSS
jgi:hypothetical protein